MKKTLLVISFFILFIAGSDLRAQQIPSFSQQMFNNLEINPAMAGTEEVFTAKALIRRQWMGIKEAPITQILGIHGPLEQYNIGIGGFIYNDITGPSRRTGIELDYAYHLEFRSFNISLGLGTSLFQFKIDGSDLNLTDPDDQAIIDGTESIFKPDVDFGIHLYKPDQYYAGISAQHLIESKLNFSDVDRSIVGELSRHYLLYGGYIFDINTALQIEPYALIKYVRAAPVKVDFNTKFMFMDQFWFGLSYRSFDAVGLFTGIILKDQYHIGYAFDIATTDIMNHTYGSHEIMLGYDFLR